MSGLVGRSLPGPDGSEGPTKLQNRLEAGSERTEFEGANVWSELG